MVRTKQRARKVGVNLWMSELKRIESLAKDYICELSRDINTLKELEEERESICKQISETKEKGGDISRLKQLDKDRKRVAKCIPGIINALESTRRDLEETREMMSETTDKIAAAYRREVKEHDT